MIDDGRPQVSLNRMEPLPTRRTLLVVDDVAVSRLLLTSAFKGDYTVLEAADGIAAMETLRERADVTCVLLDIVMPRLDGFGVLTQMRGDARLSEIPVIVVTGSDSDADQIRALDLGALDIVEKPFNPRVVRRRVDNIIRRHEADRLATQISLFKEHIHQSEIDPKTGIYTKEAFCRRTQEMLLRHPERRCVICRWDIDRFKVYNDVFGMAEGDRLLAQIGEAYRTGGITGILLYGHLEADHFIACIDEASFTRDRIEERLNDFVATLNPAFEFVPRLGVYRVDDPTLDVSLMCDRALLALRAAKRNYARRVVWYDDSMRESLLEEQEIVADMNAALTQAQFEVWLQPQYNYATHALHGAEALVRWRHPTRGLIPPGKFIPIFERNGFVNRMDEYVWEQTCALLRRWLDAGLTPVPVSVNISRLDIYGTHPCDKLLALLKKYRLDASLLRLEITESSYMENPEQLIKTVTEMRQHGFCVEMDDFGSGYSSLNTLKEVPVDVLKMDMRFLDAGANDQKSGRILSSVIRMASWIDLPVIAEGVETREQADYLKSLGCVLMQGYYFSRPIPVAEYEGILQKGLPVPVTAVPSETNVEGAIDFLNASTQATLMFNSFLGGAQIVELNGDTVESLRVNDQFFAAIGCTREEYAGNERRMQDRFFPESRAVFLETLREAIRTGREQQCELHSLPISAGRPAFWTFLRARYLARNGQRYILYVSVENITERKQLDETRERLDDIVRNVPAGIAIYERQAQLAPLFISDRVCAMFGYTREEYDARMAAGSPIRLTPEAQLALWSDGATPTDAPSDVTLPARRKDGSWFWLRVVSSVVRREDRPPLIYATLLDVTAQHASEEELSALVQSMPGGIVKYAADEEGCISYVSDNLPAMLGYTRAQFDAKFGGRVPRLICDADRERVANERRAQSVAGSQAVACEYRIETADGTLKWVYSVGHLARELDGTAFYYVILMDIDQRRRLESEVWQQKRQAEALIANAPGGVVTFVIQGGSIVREFISEGVARLYGCGTDEIDALFGEDIYARVHPDDQLRLRASARRALRERVMFREQYRIRRKDDSYIWVNLTGNPVVDGDGTIRFYCTYSDITAQIETDEQLRIEKQKTEYAIESAQLLVWEYDIASGNHVRLSRFWEQYFPTVIAHGENAIIEAGLVHPDSERDYRALHEAVRAGEPNVTREMLLRAKDGAYAWWRATYRTLFSEGKPIGAIGSAIDITAETDATARKREMELALEASSLYFWTYDLRRGTYPTVNRNAARLGIGRQLGDRQAGLLDCACLTEAGRAPYERIIRAQCAGGAGNASDAGRAQCAGGADVSGGSSVSAGSDGESVAVLRMSRAQSGMEWMRVTCSAIPNRDGEIVSLAIVGEDVTDSVLNERMYAEALANVRAGDQAVALARIQVDLTADRVEVSDTAFVTVGMRYSDAVARLGDVVFTPAQRENVLRLLSRDHLIEAYERGEDSVAVRYQRFLNGERAPRWVRTTAHAIRDAVSGVLTVFQHTVDIDAEMTERGIAGVLSEHVYELLGLIFVGSGCLRCCRRSAWEDAMAMAADAPYDDLIAAFVGQYVCEDSRALALADMRLDTVLRRLADKPRYCLIYPMSDGGARSFKRFEFFWLDDTRETVVVARSDATEAENLRERSEEMRVALLTSGTTVCRYDVRQDRLTLPEDFAAAVGLPATIDDAPEHLPVLASGDRSGLRRLREQIRAGEMRGQFDAQFALPNGERRWQQISFVSQFGEDGAPVSAVITLRDITAQRVRDIENERNRLLLERNGIAIFDYDVKNDILHFETFHKDKGVIRTDFPNYYDYVTHSAQVHPDSAETLRAMIRAARERPVSGTAEYVADNWGTGYQKCRITYSSVADDAGDVYRLVGQIGDASDASE